MYLTGEFSRMAHISKRMLQHYDRIGLFSPEYTDPKTGYRYYSAKQLPRLNRILALKDLGLSLDQVHRMIDNDISLDEMRGMLLMQKAELEQQLRESYERIQRVESRLARMEGGTNRPAVILKSVDAQPYLSLRRVFADLDEGKSLMGQLLTGLPGKLGKNSLGDFASVMYSPVFDVENMDTELGFHWNGDPDVTITLNEDMVLTVQELPAVEIMATVVHIGSMDMLPAGYEAITEWVEANGYHVIGAQREIYLEIPASGNSEELVTEIQFPVEKRSAELNLLSVHE